MKLQHLAVIFVLIILPISLVLSEYIQSHVATVQLESQYTTRLISSTHDAALAFQVNTANNGYSTSQDSKMRDVDAAISTFYRSLCLAMGSDGYTEEDLQLYTPAVLCTLYDGYYIYTKYNDVKYANTDTYYDGTKNVSDTASANNLTVDHYVYGLKPFISYSCRYKKGTNYDFVVNYTLDNTITIIGKVANEDVTKSGHLIELKGSLTGISSQYELTDSNKDRIDQYIDEQLELDIDDSEDLSENLVILRDDRRI